MADVKITAISSEIFAEQGPLGPQDFPRFSISVNMSDGQHIALWHKGKLDGLGLEEWEITYMAVKRELERRNGTEPDYRKKIREEVA